MSISAKSIATVLGGTKSLGKRITTMRELEALVAGGLPKSALDSLIAEFDEHYTERSAIDMRYRIVSRATYRRTDRFNLQTSETIERIARLYAMALATFIEPVAATRFMMRNHAELEQRSPFEAALTELGGRAVEEVIERGLHGLPV